MGKEKKNKQVKNVFKVAGARSLKLKNKAKAVSLQLKKLNEDIRKKTAEVDGQLTAELQVQLLQKQDIVKPKQDIVKEISEESVTNKEEELLKYQETVRESIETLGKLCGMQI
ncbi:hypothetical protein C0J52_12601 [Blattella germanica]|nr:hypothetical protein C0J52_12601 [Blattella germanica]